MTGGRLKVHLLDWRQIKKLLDLFYLLRSLVNRTNPERKIADRLALEDVLKRKIDLLLAASSHDTHSCDAITACLLVS